LATGYGADERCPLCVNSGTARFEDFPFAMPQKANVLTSLRQVGFASCWSIVALALSRSSTVALKRPCGMGLAEHEPHRRNDLGDDDRNRDGNDRLPENAPTRPLWVMVTRGGRFGRGRSVGIVVTIVRLFFLSQYPPPLSVAFQSPNHRSRWPSRDGGPEGYLMIRLNQANKRSSCGKDALAFKSSGFRPEQPSALMPRQSYLHFECEAMSVM
jgi:hypothetical protein